MNTFGILGILVSSTLVFLIVSCKTTKPVTPSENQALLYELERTGCLGDCPVYRLQVYANRLINIIPRRGINVSKPTSDTLSETEFESLRSSMANMQSAHLDSSYDNRVMDAPFAVIRLIGKEKTQTIKCRGDEPPAFALGVQALENLAIERSWVLGTAKMAQSQNRELIIELAAQDHIPRLEEKYNNYGLEFIKTISPRQLFYLFSTSVPDLQSESFLNLLKEDALVLKVQWNHQLKKRDE